MKFGEKNEPDLKFDRRRGWIKVYNLVYDQDEERKYAIINRCDVLKKHS